MHRGRYDSIDYEDCTSTHWTSAVWSRSAKMKEAKWKWADRAEAEEKERFGRTNDCRRPCVPAKCSARAAQHLSLSPAQNKRPCSSRSTSRWPRASIISFSTHTRICREPRRNHRRRFGRPRPWLQQSACDLLRMARAVTADRFPRESRGSAVRSWQPTPQRRSMGLYSKTDGSTRRLDWKRARFFPGTVTSLRQAALSCVYVLHGLPTCAKRTDRPCCAQNLFRRDGWRMKGGKDEHSVFHLDSCGNSFFLDIFFCSNSGNVFNSL